jgi:glycosyltransferase involved in cell wall biosynthesis
VAPPASVGLVVQSYSTLISSTPFQLAEGLAELGHQVEVVTTRAPDARALPYSTLKPPADGPEFPLSVVHVPYAGVVRDNVVVLPTWQPFNHGYDCLILHEDYPSLSLSAGIWAVRHNVPYLLATERYYYPRDRLTQAALRLADHTTGRLLWARAALGVFHTRASQRFFAELGNQACRSAVIPGTIDAIAFRKAVRRRNGDAISSKSSSTWLLCVARLHSYKGLGTLLEAVARLTRAGLDLKLRIVGRGPDEPSLRAQAEAFGISERVFFDTVPIPNDRMAAVYGAADIYVQPSLWEPFGSSTAEAMACALPVVASATGGLLDSVQDGITGFLVPPGDGPALANRVRQLVLDPALARKMGDEGQRISVSRLDRRVVARTYSEWIERVVQ